jgi:tetratricopeptide (TPR) repeat protein
MQHLPMTARDAADADPVRQARHAADAGDWVLACQLLVQADARAPLAGADLELLANTAYAAGHLDLTIETWERAHAAAIQQGDRVAAAGAAVRVALHLLFDTALLAAIRGWAAVTERLLEGTAGTPVHAWLAVVHSYERLLSGDFDAAREWARRAVEVGSTNAPAAAAIGRVAEARTLILQGEVATGIDRLNEAAVAAMSSALDPLSTGIVYCEVVCGFQALAQYDLAEQWTHAMERWRGGRPVGSIHGRCRLHRAEILRLRGRSADAEQEALQACEELRPYLKREFGWPLTELGRIRLRRGDLDGAETAFVAAHASGWDPEPGLALLRLARADVPAAVALIRHALEHPMNVPSKELPPHTELRRAPLLDAEVAIEVAAGDLDRAESAARELAGIATTFQSAALAASAAVACGRVHLARGDWRAARQACEDAVRRWTDIGAPYDAAVARLLLADALAGGGHAARAAVEREAARAAIAEAGAALPAQVVTSGPPGAARDPAGSVRAAVTSTARTSGSDGRFRCEGEYWLISFGGETCRLRDAKGLRYLRRLLAEPGREWLALDLAGGLADEGESSGRTRAALGDAGPALDARAKAAYRRRLVEIETDLAEAEHLGDAARAAQAMADRAFIARELARAVGLGGRDRRTASATERARVSVTRAIRHALSRIHAHAPRLGAHLDHAIRTGTYCAYEPDPAANVHWDA